MIQFASGPSHTLTDLMSSRTTAINSRDSELSEGGPTDGKEASYQIAEVKQSDALFGNPEHASDSSTRVNSKFHADANHGDLIAVVRLNAQD